MSGRAKAQCSVVVRRKPEEVFAYPADVRRHAEWSPKAYRVEGVDGPVGLGSRFTSYGWVPKDAEHRNDVEVTEFEPSTRLRFTAREKGEDFLSTYVLTPQGDATRVDKLIDMPKPAGVSGALFPLVVGGFIRPATQKGMNMLKAELEAGT
ncbi:MAG: SRPBCC family protein [Actinomycetota bacterium]